MCLKAARLRCGAGYLRAGGTGAIAAKGQCRRRRFNQAQAIVGGARAIPCQQGMARTTRDKRARTAATASGRDATGAGRAASALWLTNRQIEQASSSAGAEGAGAGSATGSAPGKPPMCSQEWELTAWLWHGSQPAGEPGSGWLCHSPLIVLASK